VWTTNGIAGDDFSSHRAWHMQQYRHARKIPFSRERSSQFFRKNFSNVHGFRAPAPQKARQEFSYGRNPTPIFQAFGGQAA